jgi:hypothetical protein
MIKEMVGAVAVLLLTVGSVYTIVQYEVAQGHQTRMINCSIAEISPDFTPAMRQACREARMQPTKEYK